MKVFLLSFLLVNGFISTSYSQELHVAFEPFPPFITEQGNGYTVDMLREIEKISDLTFSIEVTTYKRAKRELKQKRIDIAGHTPKNLETEAFYHYGLELDWQINTTSDLFTLNSQYLSVENIRSRFIGTTSGNAEFFAQQLGIPAKFFVEVSSLNQLVDMLLKGRLDVILFERASVMTLLEQKGVSGVYFKAIGNVPASIAVTNDKKGKKLKQQLDDLIGKLDLNSIFSGYLKYTALPNVGKTQ